MKQFGNLKIGWFWSLVILNAVNFSCNLTQKQDSTKDEKSNSIQDENQNLSYELINQVIDDHIIQDKAYFLLYQMRFMPFSPHENSDDYLELSKYDSILSDEDIKHIYRQIDDLILSKDFDLQQDRIKNQNITILPILQYNQFRDKILAENKKLAYWEELEKEFHIYEYYSISYPVFSIDQQTAIISFGHHCGSLCGNGSIEIYQRKNGKWVSIKYITNWVS